MVERVAQRLGLISAHKKKRIKEALMSQPLRQQLSPGRLFARPLFPTSIVETVGTGVNRRMHRAFSAHPPVHLSRERKKLLVGRSTPNTFLLFLFKEVSSPTSVCRQTFPHDQLVGETTGPTGQQREKCGWPVWTHLSSLSS